MNTTCDADFTTLYDEQGQLYGVLVSPALWEKLKDQAEALAGRTSKQEELPPEPLKNWKNLVASWDFNYPVDTDVQCGACGAATEDWQQDDPKKFHLKVANYTGIVSFQCLQCKAKIIKRHFTDKISVETLPFQEKKTYRCDACRER